MRKTALTQRRVDAALAAVCAMLAGEDNEGDWPPDITREDLDGARLALLDRLSDERVAAIAQRRRELAVP